MSLELLFLLWNQTTPELKLFFQEKLFIFGQILLQKGKNIEKICLNFYGGFLLLIQGTKGSIKERLYVHIYKITSTHLSLNIQSLQTK